MERRQFVKTMGVGFAGFCVAGSADEVALAAGLPAEGSAPQVGQRRPEGPPPESTTEVLNAIRREKFDTILLEVMRKNKVDMWMHVMRESIPDPFGEEDLGSTSGVFVFTDRGGNRAERAILERRWGDSFAAATWRVNWDTRTVETCGAYDIIAPAVLVKEPSGPDQQLEYDLRFADFKKFVAERNPKTIAVNFKMELGPYATTTHTLDGLSHTDYLLLARAIGPEYAARLTSSEHVMMDYIIRRGPVEIAELKRLRGQEDIRVKKSFDSVVPGVSKNRDVNLTLFRPEPVGISQRGRSPGYENLVIQGGDILASPSQGSYAYVLRKGEKEPPPEIQKYWALYRKVDEILFETVKVGLTPREIVKAYKPKFAAAGFIVLDEQLQFATPPEDFGAYHKGLDPMKPILNVDCHGMAKGARKRKYENYFCPRIGSNGPIWMWDVPLPPNHHMVMEYFFYMPVPIPENKDQYYYFWDHEQVLVDPEKGIQYLSPMKKELVLIPS